MTTLICKYCNKSFETSNKNRKYCSRECFAGWLKTKTGTSHHLFKGEKQLFKCDYCGEDVIKGYSDATRYKHHFCNKECMSRWQDEKWVTPDKKIEVTCAQCGNTLKINPYKIKTIKNHFCNRKCSTKYAKEHYSKGENNPNYKGGPVKVTCAYCSTEFEMDRGNYSHQIKDGQTRFFCCRRHNDKWRSIYMTGENACAYKKPKDRKSLKTKQDRDETWNRDWIIRVFIRDQRKCVICGSNHKINAHHINSFTRFPDMRTDIDNGATMCYEHHREFHKIYGQTEFTAENFYEYLQSKKQAKAA